MPAERGRQCSACARAFHEEWPGGRTALRCGYRAGGRDGIAPGPDGIRMIQPDSCYGRITQVFPSGKHGCTQGEAPAWCRGYTQAEK